jgi:hypothetical protein
MLVLRLFHGRPSADMNLDQWGVDGPRIPVMSVRWTYGEVSLNPADRMWLVLREAGMSSTGRLPMDGDCIRLGGVSYGDWHLAEATASDLEQTADDLAAAMDEARVWSEKLLTQAEGGDA